MENTCALYSSYAVSRIKVQFKVFSNGIESEVYSKLQLSRLQVQPMLCSIEEKRCSLQLVFSIENTGAVYSLYAVLTVQVTYRVYNIQA